MTYQLWLRKTRTVCKSVLTARQKSRNSLNETSITALWLTTITSRYKPPSTTNRWLHFRHAVHMDFYQGNKVIVELNVVRKGKNKRDISIKL